VVTDTNDILSHRIGGKGQVLVLLHGYLCSGNYWDSVRPQLEKKYTVITIDLLGFGTSPRPRKSSYDYDEHLTWIRRTLQHITITGPIVLVGHSMGALLALRYGTLYPDRIKRLVLVNLPLFQDRQQAKRELAGTNLFFRVSLYWRMHHLVAPVMRTKRMKAIARQLANPMYKGMEEYVFSSSGIARGRSLHNIIEAQRVVDDLGQVQLPTTIIAGYKERPIYLENIKRLKKRKNIRVIFADTGHHTPLEAPALLVDILQQK
jgi:pimeloyl-ACP methyl ester carboxylesterase